MKNIFIIPLAATFILVGAAICLSPLAVLPVLLGILGLASAAAAVFLAKKEGKDEIAVLLEPIEALRQNKSADFPANASDDAKRIVTSVKGLAEARDAAVNNAKSVSARAEEYKNQLEKELAQGQKLSAEQTDFRYSLRYATHKTQLVYNNLAGEIHHLSQMVADIGHSMEMQNFNMQQTSTAMEQVAGSIGGVSESVSKAAENAKDSRAKAHSGQSEVRDAVEVMNSAKAAFTAFKGTMHLFGQQSESINSIMKVISDLADQTVRLAVNAAIEAARAGENENGAAAVAGEVRKLAEKTMQAANDISSVVRAIQDTAKQNILAVESVSSSITRSSEQFGKAETLMDEMARGIIEAADELQGISGAINEQTENCRHTSAAIQNMHEVIRESAERMIEFTGRLVSIAGSVEELEISTGMLSGLREEESQKRSRIVEWAPALATGIELIDYQHKMLCLYINTLYRATVHGADMKVISDIVDFLKIYTLTHFATEERYFDHSGYPDAESHKRVHVKFAEKVVQVQNDLYSGKITVGEDLLNFLKDWLVNHIKGTDHEYASFLKAYLARVKAENAKARAQALTA